MGFPERLYRGGALVLEGRVLRPAGASFHPVLVLRRGERVLRLDGAWGTPERSSFLIFLSSAFTSQLEPGLWEYELYLVAPDQEEYVVSRGSVEVEERLAK